MSRYNNSTKSDWDSQFTSGPNVVTANFNNLTNEFEITPSRRPPPARSKFDFGNVAPSQSWAVDSQRGWGGSPETQAVWNEQGQEDHGYVQDKFSTREPEATTTFRLNMDIEDAPIFSKVTDYTAFRGQDIIPNFEQIVIAEELRDPNEWDQRNYRDPFPDVPVNRVKQPYDSTDQYLYTHFELMRQDFLIPLQKAVKGYKEVFNDTNINDDAGISMEQVSQQRPYRLYEHVHLNAIVFGTRQPLYRVSFRLPYYVRVNWQQSKRLMPGTLVLLSKDHFEKDLKVATIVNRGDEPMRGPNRFEYLVDIYLERDDDEQPLGFGDPSLTENDTYVMIEATDGYFEAYRHVLNVFKNVKADQLPFSDYLVKLSNEVLVPHYAAQKNVYDINVQSRNIRRDRWPVNILEEWPSYNTGMDRTQMDALRTILSHNLSIVQGPPGTGKTFVGTYAMRVLLNNFDNSMGPIVCICQTNHALDQFLEHILDYTTKIVRVGGRSKSELLKEHTLYELKKEHDRPRGIARLYRDRDGLVKAIRETIIELYEEPCVTIEYIESIKGLRPKQIDSLKRAGEREKSKPVAAATSLNDYHVADDSDDEWVVSSEPVKPKAPVNSRNNRNNNRQKPHPSKGRTSNKGANNDWAGGNPNTVSSVKEKTINPVEGWLKDAIDYVDDAGEMSSLADDLKQSILEQEKGLVFDDTTDERDMIEEEELQEVIIGFQGDDQPETKYPFIQIGKNYKRQTEVAPGERPERKIVNYSKMKTTNTFESTKFNFFDDNIDEAVLEQDSHNHSLERWMKDDDLSMWPLPVRLKAHKMWIDQRNAALEAKLNALMRQYYEKSQSIRRVIADFEARICRQNRVVGMTSTAAAKYHDLLEEMRPRVMVVEEAAEMLESHIISALTNSLEHLILIGDHQQLRPSTAVHELAENHALGVSLFERLVMNDFPFTRLSHQRRMRPEIRSLINPIYKDPPLMDHPDVLTYPPIRGMDQSLFFLAHNEDETNMSESASKVNEHEAKMAAKLAVYLLLQGYQPQEITIITMYSGQKTMIKRALRDERRPDMDPELIQVSSVDGYQGEENKIIILSLVRSNAAGQIGFLKVVNRVCVSLSRAKHGFYILGNARLLCERSDLWNEIIGNLEDQNENMVGTKLVLKCQKHGQPTQVQWPVDFTTVEEGGCQQQCNELLPCGHRCTLKCHPYDHNEYRCKQQCEKFLECNHQCMRRCCEPCGSCIKPLSCKLPCGHTLDSECGIIRRLVLRPEGKKCPVCQAPLK
ncbi:RNA helicase [Parasitella parasitica]|nr:RNA helicase [Parasitella parasitica]